MSNPKRRGRRTALLASVVALLAVGSTSTTAYAETGKHYYIQLGGTGAALDAPDCTKTYGYANQHLDGGIPVPICYPASIGPFVDSQNNMPAPHAPSLDDSVQHGYDNALEALEDIYRSEPDARFTIVGYSQGAQVADLLLQTVSAGETDVPRSRVNGMLYSDPMQPGTGLWARVPKGGTAFGITSPGPGPEKFPGVPVQRFCIKNDGVCDATSVHSIGGILSEHPLYPRAGGVITQTIGDDGGEGTVWY